MTNKGLKKILRENRMKWNKVNNNEKAYLDILQILDREGDGLVRLIDIDVHFKFGIAFSFPCLFLLQYDNKENHFY